MTRASLRTLAAALGTAAACVSPLAFGRTLAAQGQPASVVVRVRVQDQQGAPVDAAELTVFRGVKPVAPLGRTDSTGARGATLALPRGRYELVVRRIGYARAEQFFTVGERDTVPLAFVLVRSPQALVAFTVTERQAIRKRLLSFDADAIVNAKTYVGNGLEAVVRLRPDMEHGLSGDCSVAYVWVNGKRIDALPDPMIVDEIRMMTQARADAAPMAASSRNLLTDARGEAGEPPSAIRGPARAHGRTAFPADVATVLASIKPEHIAEVSEKDCNDTSMPGSRQSSAIFVVLKDGVQYDVKKGSFVSEETLLQRLHIAAAPPVAPAPVAPAPIAPPAPRDTTPRYRYRVLGVFDDASGTPLGGVEVADVRTGWKATTTATGTITLVFLPAGASTLRLSHPGYRTVELPVMIAPSDTLPITTLLARTP